ncbi:PTS system, glucose/glucosamine/beta-glucoside-specific, IICBA component [Mycoplasmopsis maculosa]|uniref:PTS system, glucose/glucosamine/beta-glucoside-specific, IICBA component n=1 Tax=Mycoplasmopsis maculosa TaxID=114885 RepID=A0A449B3Q9_9BACT|nr:PTS glucose transporter subunit IIA [Mycoplasmopsis maculosa]VEU75205.1 PTS system, glucose/glucosamine/beta-glucoside-specific, IICBA component [Mycoplasmopsis maculosa]
MGIKKFFSNIFKKNKKIKKVEVSNLTRDLVDAFGGISNILGCYNCAVRLRYDVRDTSLVNEEKLRELGATEVIFIGKRHVQARFGEPAEQYNLDVKNSLETLKAEAGKLINVKEINLLNEKIDENTNKKDELIVYAPVSGQRFDLDSLDNLAFSKLGSGYALKIDENLPKLNIYAPISGKIVVGYPSKHAYGIQNKNGLEVLLHIGTNTNKLNGLGFESNIKLNDEVKQGQLIATLDLSKVKELNLDPSVIVIVTSLEHKKNLLKNLSLIEVKENSEWFKVLE